MAKLTADEYDKMIDEFNKCDSSSVNHEEQVQKLKKAYDDLTKLSDNEEIIYLMNLCIAEDRLDNQSREDLYNHYLHLREIVEHHGSLGISNRETVIYDLGILSFKFHDYEWAIRYFSQAEPLLGERHKKNIDSLPYLHDYVSCMILHAYSLEYRKIGEGALEALSFILLPEEVPSSSITVLDEAQNTIDNISAPSETQNSIDIISTLNEKLEKLDITQEPDEIIKSFFNLFQDAFLFNWVKNADGFDKDKKNSWLNELVHVTAHCLSEASVYLKKKRNEKRKDEQQSIITLYSTLSFKLEILSEKFITFLEEYMLTCKAIIFSEHGLYWNVMDAMIEKYNELAEESTEEKTEDKIKNEKERAELAFYIYYFNNRVSNFDDAVVNECKEFFLRFAADSGNKETKFYADIIDFREKLAQSILNNPSFAKKHQALSKLADNIHNLDDKFKPTYIHPQIKEEKEKLLLAHEILSTYYLQLSPGFSETDEADSFLEKCILFNTNSSLYEDENVGKQPDSIQNSESYNVHFHGLNIHIIGLSSEIIKIIETAFSTKCTVSNIDPYSTNAVFICDEDEKIKNAIKELQNIDVEKYDFQVYLSPQFNNRQIKDQILSARKKKTAQAKISFLATEEITELSECIKLLYVRQTIKNCLLRAKRWDECFISAPITDNETFAFQSKNINQYIKVSHTLSKDEKTSPKQLFKEYGRTITEDTKVNSIRSINVKIPNSLSQKFKRLYYYNNTCLYEFNKSKNANKPETFSPMKLFEDISGLKAEVRRNYFPADVGDVSRVRDNLKMSECDCFSQTNIASTCICYGKALKDRSGDDYNNFSRLLMEARIDSLANDENAYVLISSDELISDREPLCSFLLIIEGDNVITHCDFVRLFFDLNNACESQSKNVFTVSYPQTENQQIFEASHSAPLSNTNGTTVVTNNIFLNEGGIMHQTFSNTEIKYQNNIEQNGSGNIINLNETPYETNSHVLSEDELNQIKNCFDNSNITKEDFYAFYEALKDILTEKNAIETDILVELANLSANFSESRNTAFSKKLQEKVTLTNGLINLGHTAAGIAQSVSGMTLLGVMEEAIKAGLP